MEEEPLRKSDYIPLPEPSFFDEKAFSVYKNLRSEYYASLEKDFYKVIEKNPYSAHYLQEILHYLSHLFSGVDIKLKDNYIAKTKVFKYNAAEIQEMYEGLRHNDLSVFENGDIEPIDKLAKLYALWDFMLLSYRFYDEHYAIAMAEINKNGLILKLPNSKKVALAEKMFDLLSASYVTSPKRVFVNRFAPSVIDSSKIVWKTGQQRKLIYLLDQLEESKILYMPYLAQVMIANFQDANHGEYKENRIRPNRAGIPEIGYPDILSICDSINIEFQKIKAL